MVVTGHVFVVFKNRAFFGRRLSVKSTYDNEFALGVHFNPYDFTVAIMAIYFNSD